VEPCGGKHSPTDSICGETSGNVRSVVRSSGDGDVDAFASALREVSAGTEALASADDTAARGEGVTGDDAFEGTAEYFDALLSKGDFANCGIIVIRNVSGVSVVSLSGFDSARKAAPVRIWSLDVAEHIGVPSES